MSYICHISTALPQYTITTKEMSGFVSGEFQDDALSARKFALLTRDDSISCKHIVISDFLVPRNERQLYLHKEKEPTTAERMCIYEREALKLSIQSVQKLFQESDLKKDHITHIIYVSCTGMVAPGIECQLAEYFDMRADIQRYAVNFMGCYAAFQGLKIADMIAQTHADAEVLVVFTELCSLHFRRDGSDDNLLSTFLFSDGSAAAWVSGKKPTGRGLQMEAFSSYLMHNSKKEMGWYMRDLGFEMVLKRDIPKRIEENMRKVFLDCIQKQGLTENQIEKYAIHPGGKSILMAFEKALHIPNSALDNSYNVLKNNGNMSSVTILFVLKSYLEEAHFKDSSYVYSAAFGPGLTIEQAIFKTTSS